MKNKFIFTIVGYIFIGISMITALIMVNNTNLLIPAGYALSVDGVVISKNLMVVFLLFSLSWLGYHLLKK